MIQPRSYLEKKENKTNRVKFTPSTVASIFLTVAIPVGMWHAAEPSQEKPLVIPAVTISTNTSVATETKVTVINSDQEKRPEIEKTDRKGISAEHIIRSLDKHLKGKLKGKGQVYYNIGKKYNVNPMLMAAISIHETAHGTSEMVRTLDNVGGITWSAQSGYPRRGRWINFTAVGGIDESIRYMGAILKRYYIDEGRKDIVSIGQKYCPEYDPESGSLATLNKHWVPKVTEYYNAIMKDIK